MGKINKITLEGIVTKDIFGKGTASEHKAVYLTLDEKGDLLRDRYKLRRKNANPFQDDVLDGLVGKNIQATGYILDYLFIVESYTEIDPLEN